MKKIKLFVSRDKHSPLRRILKIMKLTTFILLITNMMVSASVYSQSTKLTLNYSGISFGNLFQKIEEQSEFRFAFSSSKFNQNQKVQVNINKGTLEEILDETLPSDVSYEIIDRYVVIVNAEKKGVTALPSFQKKSVTGKITDTDGQPLPGVTVIVKGTSNGTVSNSSGEYSIAIIPEGATLVFSFVGMKTEEVSVNGQATINVTMEMDAIGIEEVVAVGYGTMKKANVTNALTGVKDEELQERAVSNVDEALAGQMAGVRIQQASGVPGEKSIIKIRGVNSINSGNEPLYVVDGITVSDLTQINIDDVESIQVLKDASSAAIYGARGANGVILVTTKSGTTGAPVITFDSYVGMQQAEKLYEVMNKEEITDYIVWARNEAYYRDQGGSPSTPWAERPSQYQIPQNWIDDWDNNLANLPDNNWQDKVYRNALLQSYQLSVSGGTDKTKYFISGRFFDQDGIVIETGMKRTTFRAKVETELNKRLRVGLNLAPTFSVYNTSGTTDKESIVHHTLYMLPTTRFDEQTYDTGMVQYFPNPIEKLKRRTAETRSTDVNMSAYGELDLIKNMTFRSSYAMYSYDMNNKLFYPLEVENGQYHYGSYTTNKIQKWQLDNTLTYMLDLEDNTFNFLLGQSCEYRKLWYSDQQSRGYPNAAVYTLNVATDPTSSTTTETEEALASYFGRIQYNYRDKYLFSVSARYDGSSRFGINNKWGLFPAVSAGWKISEESFMEDVSWVNQLKLRASVGLAGNDNIGNYAWIGTVNSANYNFNDELVNGYLQSGIENSDFSWETTQSTDIGIDLGAFNNRFQMALDYYSNTTKDVLMDVPVPSQSGYSSMTRNYGKVRNNGFETELTGVILNGKLKWESSFNLSYNKNEVLKVQDPFNMSYGGIYSRVEEGHPMYGFYMFKIDGILTPEDMNDNTLAKVDGTEVGGKKYVDTNNDGEIDENDRTWVGNPYPEFIYGITNRFHYRNFDFSFMFQAQTGSDILFMFARQIDGGASNGFYNQLKRWANSYRSEDEPGDGRTHYPFARGLSRWDTNDLYDASYIRLKNITLGYNLPKTATRTMGIAGMRLYLTADNVFTHFFDKDFPGVTTESNTSRTYSGFGADYATYPLARKISLGIKVNF